MTREQLLIALSLINEWKYHCKETGFLQWKQNTPLCAYEAEKQLMEFVSKGHLIEEEC